MRFETILLRDGEEIPVEVDATIEYDPGEIIEPGHSRNGRGRGYYVSRLSVFGVDSLSSKETELLSSEALDRKDDHMDARGDDGVAESSKGFKLNPKTGEYSHPKLGTVSVNSVDHPDRDVQGDYPKYEVSHNGKKVAAGYAKSIQSRLRKRFGIDHRFMELESAGSWDRNMFILDQHLPDIVEDDTVEADALKIAAQVEQYLGDVVDPDMDEAAAKEECWTLCIDAANDLFGQGTRAISAAKVACTNLGYGDERQKSMAKPVWPPQAYRESFESDGNEDIDSTNQTLDDFLKGPEAKKWNVNCDSIEWTCNELRRMIKPGYGLSLGGYAYYPKDKRFTRWVASDGSKVDMAIADLIFAYGGKDVFIDFMSAGDPSTFDHYIVKKKKDQSDHESGVMAGDHY